MRRAGTHAQTPSLARLPLRLVPPLVVLLGVLALVGDGAALAGTAHAPASSDLALRMVQPASSDTPSLRVGAVFPPPPSIPAGVSICGPLFSNTSLPMCQATGTTISIQKGGLGAYGLAMRTTPGHGFPNLTRDVTLSQEAASGLYVVLGHGKFDGLLGDTQVLMLDVIARRLGQTPQPGNVYRLEVDQKTGNLDFRDYLVGSATFTYVP